MTKQGSGVFTLSGNNTYSGTTTVSAGELIIESSNALGSTDGGTIVASDAVLRLQGGISIGNEALSISGDGPSDNAALDNISGNNTWGGSITLTNNATIRNVSGTITLSNTINAGGFTLTLGGGSTGGIISGVISNGSLSKVATGTWTLSGNNSYSGGILLNNGQININHSDALGTGTFTVADNGNTLSIDNTSGAAITLSSNPAIALNNNLTYVGSNPLNLGTGTITMGADRTITTNGSTLTLGGTLSASTHSLSKAGAGTLAFGSNAISLNSLTINEGSFTSTSGTLTLAGSLTSSGTFNNNNGTVSFTGNGLTIPGLAYHHLTLSNTSGTNTAGGNITVNGTLTTTAGGTLDMSSYTLDGTLSGISNAGILKTAATGATPIPASKTWGGSVEFYANDAQTIPGGTFNKLIVTDTDAGTNYQKTASEGILVNDTLKLVSGNFSASIGNLHIPNGYMSLGASAKISGSGNITGTVRRSHTFQNSVFYPFTGANQGTLFGSLPDQTSNPLTLYIKATTGSAIPTEGCSGTVADATSRYYTVWKDGNWDAAKSSFRTYYLESELAPGVNESNLTVWKKSVSGGTCTIAELGKSNQSTTLNFVGIALQPVNTFYSDNEDETFIFPAPTAATTLEWNGSVSNRMEIADNWSPAGLPSASVDLVIPHDVTFNYNPSLRADSTITAKSITIGAGKTLLSANNATLKLTGPNQVFYLVSGATFDPGNSTILIESGTTSSIAGTATLYNLQIASGTTFLLATNGQLTLSGTLTNNGTIDASTPTNNTFIFNGTNQTIPNTSSGVSAFHSLTLSGSGTTLPSVLQLKGNLSYTGSGIVSASTSLNMHGSVVQTISGNALTLSELIVNNADITTPGVILNTSLTLSNNLTFTNGTVVTGANTLTIGAGGSITGAGAGKYVSGNLRRYVPDTNNPSLTWEIGHDNAYSPVNLAFSGNVSGSGYIDISSTTAAPAVASGLSQTKYINRKWVVSNTDVSFSSVNPTFTFAAGNVLNSADTDLLVVRKLSGATWSALTTGTRTSTSTQATGVTEFSEFYIGEPAPLEVTTQPANTAVCETAVNTSVSAASTSVPAPTVKWQRSTGSGFTDIDGTTDGGVYSGFETTNLTISGATGLNGYEYRAVFTNINGSVNSDAATLTVDPSSVGGTVAGGQAVCTGTNSTLLTLSGNTGSVVRWESSTNGGTTWTTIAHTATTYTAENISQNTRYRAVVKSGACAEANANDTEITVDALTEGGTLSGAATVCTGTNSTLLTLSGKTGSVVRWESTTDNGTTWSNITHTATTYTATNLSQTTTYRVRVENGTCDADYSTEVTVTVDPLSAVGTATPDDAEICVGTTTTITLASSTGSIQWQQSTNNADWSNVTEGSGQTSATLTTPNLMVNTYFRAIVTSGVCASETSNSVLISMAAGSVGSIAITSGSSPVCYGENSTTLTLSGETGTIVKWQYSEDGGSTWTDITNTTNTQISEDITVTTQYRADVDVSGCGESYTGAVNIQVDPLSVAGTPSTGDNSLCAGENAVLTLSGYTGNIQWQESANNSDWSNVAEGSGGDSDEYTTPALSTTAYYRAVVTSGVCAAATSSSLTITVNALPQAPTANNTNNAYTGAVQTAGATAPSGSSIVWYDASTGGNTTSAPSATNAGTYTAWAASQADGTGCESATRTEVTLTITPVELTVTADAQAKIYDGSVFAPFTSTITGFVNMENETVISGSVTYEGTATVAVAAGAYTITPVVSGLSADNYTFSAASGALVIAQKPLTIIGITANNKTYDGTTNATASGTAALDGVEGSDDVVLGGTPVYTFVDANVATNINVNVTGFSISGADAGNYSLTQPAGLEADITVKSLTVSSLSAKNKVYDGNTTTYLNTAGYSFTGVETGDVVTLDTTAYSADFDTENVDNGKIVTVSGLGLSGADAGNYTLTAPSGFTADITARPLTPAVVVSSKIYDGTDAATITSYSVSNAISGDIVNATGGTATFDTKDVGNDKAVTIVDLTLTGADAGNYALASNSAMTTADITARELLLTADQVNKIYGDALTGGTGYTAFTSSGLQNGETIASVTVSYGNGAAATDAVDTYTDQVIISAATGGTADLSNYDITYEAGDILVGQRTLIVTALAQSKTYGETAPTSGTLNTNFTVSGLQNSDAVSGLTLGYSGTPAGNLAAAIVGSYTITPSALILSSGTLSNYNVSYNTGTLTVNTATLTVTALPQTKSYGDTAPTSGTLDINYEVTGLQNSDAASGVTLSYSGSPAGNETNAALGTYDITPSALIFSSGSTSNYTINYTGGTLTVVAGAATKLVIATIGSQTAGTSFNVLVEAQDAGNNPATVTSDSEITLSLATGTGPLSGTLTGTIIAGTSSVTISGVTYTKAESGVSITATQTSGMPSLTGATSNTFTVSTGGFTKFLIKDQATLEDIDAQTINQAFTIRIIASDDYGNTITSFTGTVNITSTGSLSAGGGTTGAFTAGILDRSVTISNNGNWTITATRSSGGSQSGTSNAFDVGRNLYAIASAAWNAGTTWSTTATGSACNCTPSAADNVYISQAGTARTVTIPSGYTALANNLNLWSSSNTTVGNPISFTDQTSILTTNKDVIISAPSAGATRNLQINTGTLNVGGDLRLSAGAAGNQNNRINQITITTGTVNVNGDLIFNDGNFQTVNALQNQIIMSGEAGYFNLSGQFIIRNGGGTSTGTLTPGTTSTFNFNGTSAQTIPIGVSSIIYRNLEINNTSSSGATFSANVTASNVAGNITVGNGSNSALLNTNNVTVARPAGTSLTVGAGSTMNAGTTSITWAGSASSAAVINGTFITADADGFSNAGGTAISNSNTGPTITLGAASTIEYNSGSTQTVTARTDYANVVLTGGSKTIASGTHTIAKNLTIESGATYNGGTNNPTLNIGGDFTNNGTFTQGTGTATFNGISQTISGASATSFTTLALNSNTSLNLQTNATVTSAFSATTPQISGTGILSLLANAAITPGTSGTTISCPVDLGNSARTFTVTDNATATVDLAISSVISGSGGGLIKAGASSTMTLSGANTYSGGTTLSAGQININHASALGSGGLTISGAGTIDNTSGSAITLSSNPAIALDAGLTFGGSNALNLGAGTITMGGDRTITTSGSTLTLGGALSAPNFSLTKAGAGTLAFGSNAINFNSITISSGSFTSTSGTLSIAGSLSNSGTFNANNGTVLYNGTSGQSVAVLTYHHLSLSGSNTKTLAGNIALGGNLTNGAGTTFSAGSNNISLAGNWSNSGSFDRGTSSVTFNGSGAEQTISGTNTFHNLTINRASGGNVSALGSTLAVTGLARIQSGTFKSATQYNDVQIDNGGTLECAQNGSIEVSGDWTNNGTFTHNLGTVTFNGTGAQTVSGTTETTFYNLTINNTAGGITLASNITAENTLTLTSGIVDATTNNKTLTVFSGGGISGGSSASFINGKLARVLNSTTKAVFPVGKGSSYRPAEFTYSTSPGTKTVTIEHFTASSPLSINTASLVRFGSSYWNISQSATGTDYTVGLHNNGATPTGSAVILRREGSGSTVQAATSFSTPYYTNSTAFSTGNTSNDVMLAETAIPLTVTGATTSNKVYDATTTATVTGGSLVGVLSPDDVTLTQAGNFATKNVGTGIAITANCSISGANAGAYTLTQPTLTARDITARALTITGAANSKTYDATTSSAMNPTITSGALQGSDVAAFTQSYDNKNVGTGKTMTPVGVVTDGNSGNNYTYTFVNSANGTITEKTLTVSGATTSDKVYDATTTASVTGGTLTGVETNDDVTLTQAGTFNNANVGTAKPITSNCSISGTDAANYTLTQPELTARDITPAGLTVTASDKTKTYGQTTPTSGVLNTHFTVSGLQGSDAASGATLGYSGSPAGNLATASVGSYTITPSEVTFSTGLTSNYDITYNNGTLTVDPAALTITADNKLKCFGIAHTFAGTEFTSSGLQNTDAVGSVTLSSTGAASGASAGTYSIVPSAAVFSSVASSNYSISYVNGTLTVNPQITVSSTKTEDPCQTGAAEITVTVSGGTSPYNVTACGTYNAPHPNVGQEVTPITNPTRTGVTTSETFSGLPGNATYKILISDTYNCPPN